MSMEYYKPKMSEFKQGFKYQLQTRRKGDKDYGYYDRIKDETIWFENKEDVWVDQEVWWDREPRKELIETKYNNITTYHKESWMDLMPNYNLATMLENGKIRAER